MTEYEFIQIISYCSELLGTTQQNFFVVFFAYVVALHVIGKELSRFFAVVISLIYSFWAATIYLSLVNTAVRIAELTEQLIAKYPNAGVYFPLNSETSLTPIILMVAPIFMAWLLSVIYVHLYVRK